MPACMIITYKRVAIAIILIIAIFTRFCRMASGEAGPELHGAFGPLPAIWGVRLRHVGRVCSRYYVATLVAAHVQRALVMPYLMLAIIPT